MRLKNAPSLADEHFRRAILGGDAVIDCVEIKLTRNGSGAPLVYAGTGSILFDPEKGAETRLVIPRRSADPYDPLAGILGQQELVSGKLIPDSHYYALEATDVAGNIWKHPATKVDVEERLNSKVVQVKCDYLRTECEIEKPGQLTAMVFMEKLPFPENVSNAAKTFERGRSTVRVALALSMGVAGGMKIQYDPRPDRPGPEFSELFAEAQEGVALPENFDDRLLEAVRYCCAMVVAPVMRETARGKRRVLELARFVPSNKGIVDPPLYPRGFEADFFHLMDRYFVYACANAKGEEYAPLSAKIGGTFTLKGVALETIALILAVAVESVLGDKSFKDLGRPSKGMLSQVQELFDHIKAAKVEGGLIERALSALGSMKSSRAADKLYALVASGSITEAETKAWKDLRNPVAHGTFHVDPAQLQELIDNIYRITTLINKLTFLLIGYAGGFTNRSVQGVHTWPTWEFGSNGVARPRPPPQGPDDAATSDKDASPTTESPGPTST
jgi:hypothetical protein